MGRWEGAQEEGTYVYLQLIHVDVRQRPIQYCKAIVLQAKKKKKEIDHKGTSALISCPESLPMPHVEVLLDISEQPQRVFFAAQWCLPILSSSTRLTTMEPSAPAQGTLKLHLPLWHL